MMPQAHAGFEVADREFHHGVAAMIGVQPDRGADPVGDERVVAPVGKQLGLGADQARCGARSAGHPGSGVSATCARPPSG